VLYVISIVFHVSPILDLLKLGSKSLPSVGTINISVLELFIQDLFRPYVIMLWLNIIYIIPLLLIDFILAVIILSSSSAYFFTSSFLKFYTKNF